MVNRLSLLAFLLSLVPAVSYSQQRSAPFQRWDENRDGKLTKSELPKPMSSRFERIDANGDLSVSRSEMETFLKQRNKRTKNTGNRLGNGRVRSNGEYVAPPAVEERVASKLNVGDAAPDFSLQSLGDDGLISLSQFKGRQPVVLVFGSITCSPFRDRVVETFKIQKKYADRAEFLMIYIREAHPESTIMVEENGKSSLRKFVQTESVLERVENAQSCTALLKVPFPTLVDGKENKTLAAYGAWPNRLVVVGKDGRIAWDSGLGPQGFQPKNLDRWLENNL